MMDRQFIKSLIPHREPFLFVDRIVNVQEGKSICAQLDIACDLPFFKGHFPKKPIMPGVLTLEALAQTSGLLLALSKNGVTAGSIFYLASSNIKFLKPLKPGSVLELNSRLVKEFGGLYQFEAEALSARERIASGTIVLAKAQEEGARA